jgi:vacuolar protein 8
VIDENKSKFRDLGGLDPLIDCLESENLESRRYALRTLCNLSFDEHNSVEIRVLGGIGPIIDCLFPTSDSLEDVETTRAALRTMCNLSVNDENKIEIRLLGGLGPVVECLSSADVKTRRDALRTICNLCADQDNKMEVRPLGGLKPILDCVESEDVETRRYALASLINLSNDEDNENAIRTLGGLFPILTALASTDLETRRFALRCLCNLAISDENKGAVGALNGNERILACCQDSDVEIRCYSFASVMHLALLPANAEALQKAGAVSLALDALNSTEPDIKRYALGLLTVLASYATSKKDIRNYGGLEAIGRVCLSVDAKLKRHSVRALHAVLKGDDPKSQAVVDTLTPEVLSALVPCVYMNDLETRAATTEVFLLACHSESSRKVMLSLELPALFQQISSEDSLVRMAGIDSLSSQVKNDLLVVADQRQKQQRERQAAIDAERTRRQANSGASMVSGEDAPTSAGGARPATAPRRFGQKPLEPARPASAKVDARMLWNNGDQASRDTATESSLSVAEGGEGPEVAALQARILDLEERFASTDADATRSKKLYSDALATISSKEEVIKMLTTGHEDLSNALKEAKDSLLQQESLISELRLSVTSPANSEDTENFKRQVSALQAELKQVAEERESFLSSSLSQKKLVDQLTAEAEALRSQSASTVPHASESDLRKLKDDLTAAWKECATLTQNVKESQSIAASAEDKVVALEEELLKVRSGATSGTSASTATEPKVEAKEASSTGSNLWEECVSLREKVTSLERSELKSRLQTEEIQKELLVLRSEARDLRARESAAVEKISSLESELNAHGESIDQHNLVTGSPFRSGSVPTQEESAQPAATPETSMEDLLIRIRSLEDALSVSRREAAKSAALQVQVNTLTLQLQEASERESAASKKVENLEDELIATQKRNDQDHREAVAAEQSSGLQHVVESSSGEKSFENNFKQAQRHLQVAQSRIEHLDGEVLRLTQSLADHVNEISSLKTAEESANRKVTELQEEVEKLLGTGVSEEREETKKNIVAKDLSDRESDSRLLQGELSEAREALRSERHLRQLSDSKIRSLEDQVAKLSSDLEHLNRDSTSLQDDLSKLQSTERAGLEKIRQLNEEISLLSVGKHGNTERLAAMQDSLTSDKGAQEAVEVLRAQYQETQSALERTRTLLMDVEGRNAVLEHRVSSLEAALDETSADSTFAKQAEKSAADRVRILEEELLLMNKSGASALPQEKVSISPNPVSDSDPNVISELKTQLSSSSEELRTLRLQLASSAESAKELAHELSREKLKLARIMEEFETMEKDAQAKIHALEGEIGRLNRTLEVNDVRSQKLLSEQEDRARKDAAEVSSTIVASSLQESQEEIMLLKKQLAEARDAHSTLQEILGNAQADNASLKASLVESKTDCRSYSEQVSDARVKIAALESEISSQAAALDTLSESLQTCLQEKESLESSNKEFRQKNGEIVRELQRAQQSSKPERHVVAQEQAEVAGLRARVAALEHELSNRQDDSDLVASGQAKISYLEDELNTLYQARDAERAANAASGSRSGDDDLSAKLASISQAQDAQRLQQKAAFDQAQRDLVEERRNSQMLSSANSKLKGEIAELQAAMDELTKAGSMKLQELEEELAQQTEFAAQEAGMLREQISTLKQSPSVPVPAPVSVAEKAGFDVEAERKRFRERELDYQSALDRSKTLQSEAEGRVEELRAELESASIKIRHLQEELEQHLSYAQAEAAGLRAKIQNLETSSVLNNSVDDESRQPSQPGDASARRESSLEKALASEREAASAARDALKRSREEIAQLQSELREVVVMKNDNDKAAEDKIRALESEVANTTSYASREAGILQEQLAKEQKASRSYLSQVQNLSSEASDLRKQLAVLDRDRPHESSGADSSYLLAPDELANKLQDANSSLKAAEHKIIALERELRVVNSNFQELESESESRLSSLYTQIQELENVASDASKECESLRAALLKSEAEKDAIRGGFEDVTTRLRVVESQDAAHLEKTSSEGELLKAAGDRVRILESELNRMTRASVETEKALREKVVHLEKSLEESSRITGDFSADLNHVAAKSQRQVAESSAMAAAAQSEVQQLQAKLRESQSFATRLQEENTRLREDLGALKDAEKKISNLENELRQTVHYAEEERKGLESRIFEMNQEMESVMNASSLQLGSDNTVTISKSQLDAMGLEVGQLKAAYADANSRVTILEDELARTVAHAERESSDLSGQINRLQEDLVKLRAGADVSASSEMKVDVAEREANRQVAAARMRQLELERSSAEKIESLEHELSTLTKHAEREVHALNARIRVLEDDLKNAQAQLRNTSKNAENVTGNALSEAQERVLKAEQYAHLCEADAQAASQRVLVLESELASQVKHAELEIRNLHARCEAAEGAMQQSDAHVQSEGSSEIMKLRVEADEAKAKADALVNALKKDLKAEVAARQDSQSRVTILQEELTAASMKIQLLSEELDKQTNYSSMESTSLATTLERVERELKQCKQQLTVAVRERDEALQERTEVATSLQQQLNEEIFGATEMAALKIRELEHELQAQEKYAKEEMAKLTESLSASLGKKFERDLMMKTAEIEEEKLKLQSAKAATENMLSREKEKLQQEISRLNAVIAVLRRDLREAQEKRATSKSKQPSPTASEDAVRRPQSRLSVDGGDSPPRSPPPKNVEFEEDTYPSGDRGANSPEDISPGNSDVQKSPPESKDAAFARRDEIEVVETPDESDGPVAPDADNEETFAPAWAPTGVLMDKLPELISRAKGVGVLDHLIASVKIDSLNELSKLVLQADSLRVRAIELNALAVGVEAMSYPDNIVVRSASTLVINLIQDDVKSIDEARKLGVVLPAISLLSSADMPTYTSAANIVQMIASLEGMDHSLVVAGATPALVHLLDDDSPVVRYHATSALRSMAFATSGKEAIRKANGLAPLIALLDTPVKSGDASTALETVRSAMRCLCVLSTAAQNRVEMRVLSGIEPIIHLLHLSSDVETRRSAAGALINLAVNARNKQEIRELDGIPPLISALSDTDADTRRFALRTLCNLALSPENQAIMMGSSIVVVSIGLLSSDDAVLRRYSARLVSLLAAPQSEEAAAPVLNVANEFRSAGAMAPLCALLSDRDEETLQEACGALSSLASTDDGRHLLLSHRAIPTIISILADACSRVRPKLQKEAALLLRNAVSSAECRAEVARRNGASALASTIASNTDPEAVVYGYEALALLSAVDAAKHELRAVDAIGSLCLGLNNDDIRIAISAAKAVFNCATAEENRAEVRRVGGLKPLVESLVNSNDNVARAGMRAVYALSIDDENEAEIARIGGLKPILNLLSSTDTEVARKAAAALCNLSIADTNKVAIRELGGIPKILQCLKSEDERLVRDCIRAVRNLSFNDENKADIRGVGGLQAIVDCMKSSDLQTARYAVRAISILSIDAENRLALAKCGAIRMVIQALSSRDTETRRSAAGSLINLSIHSQHKVEVRLQGGLAPLLECLSSDDIETVRYAARGICNLSFNEENEKEIIRLNGLDPLLKCMTGNDGEAQRSCLAALCNLSLSSEGKVEIRQLGGIEAIVSCLDISDRKPRRDAMRVIANLSLNVDNQTVLRSLGAVRTVASCMNSEDLETKRYSVRCLHVLSNTSQGRIDIRASGCLRELVECSRSHDPETKRSAVSALNALALDPAIRKEVQQLGFTLRK